MTLLHTPFRPGSHVKDVAIDGEAVLVDLRSGTYFGLDEIGTAIWHRLRDVSTGAAIAEDLVRHYDVSIEQLCCDIERFLRELHARGLVTTPDACS